MTFFKTNYMEIENGRQYLLDGKTPVSVVKAINKAKTVYSIIMGQSIITVEKERLKNMEAVKES
jgi:hypothetical protein